MADFFTRLAERALGVAPVVAPDLPPMFAPRVQPMELSTETVAPAQFANVAIPSGKPWLPNAPFDDSSSREAMKSIRERARRNDEVQSPLVDLGFSPNQAEDSAFSIRRTQDVSPAAARYAGDSSSNTPVSTIADAIKVRARKEAASPSPLPAHSPEASVGWTIRAEPAPPTIQVTIGRVEVRAVTAPAEAARPREGKAPPLLSLDQYLRQRNEGRQ